VGSIPSSGTDRYPAKQELDIRLEKRFKILGGSLTAYGDVFNLLNKLQICYTYSLFSPLYDKIYMVFPPRRFRMDL
jgi:hypothetical protein